MATERKITETDNLIVDALRNAERPMTFAELKDAIALPTGKPLAAAHITHALTMGLIAKGDEVIVAVERKAKRATYVYVNSDVATKADGKPFNYNEKELAILKYAETVDGAFTIAGLNEALGTDYKPGTFTALVNKGNLAKGDDVEYTKIVNEKKATYIVA
jgi:hypothetical protein